MQVHYHIPALQRQLICCVLSISPKNYIKKITLECDRYQKLNLISRKVPTFKSSCLTLFYISTMTAICSTTVYKLYFNKMMDERFVLITAAI